jgi:proteasome component ECM29
MKKTIEVLQHKLLTQNETNKLKEKVALTLSYICVGRNSEDSDSSDELNHLIMQKLLDSAQIKQIELHMTLGEALVNCAMGNKSPALRNSWTCTEQEWIDKIKETKLQDDKILNNSLNWLLNQLLEKYIDNPNPHLRQAASFWLLTLMKKCSTLVDFIDKNLMAIQDAFILRLGENDEVTQEVASKAIGLIYTLANSEQKKYLVSKLMDTLSGNNSKKSTSSTIKIKDENEEIFKQEQIGKTPDGANITTYKELCSLASDLNQPDLIYRFMNLASHNSMWNTRRGVAFGFQTIANLSTDELQAHLPSLVPRLYRYQFDPNPKIQQSMISIWNSVITQDNKKIIDQYLDIILDDIEKNMLSNLWRIRESCCLALCDLLKGGRNLEPIIHKFGAFWSLLFKLIDDIKESVRQAAEIAIKSLNRVTISYSSSITNLSICENTIKSVIPILIQDGFNSKLDTVRDISVKTVLELTKQSISSEFLKPYLLDLIPNLLETLSGYEPPDLNYISLKASNDLQEKLDLARVNASRSTPMFEIINLNLKFIVEPLLSELIPRLVDLVKRGLGVATKAGVCHLISLLIDQSPALIAPYAGKLMAVFVNALSSEINKTTRKAYSNCLGSIVKTAKESSIENLLNKLKEWYFEKDGIFPPIPNSSFVLISFLFKIME